MHVYTSYGTLHDVSLCIYGHFAVFKLLYYMLGQEGPDIKSLLSRKLPFRKDYYK